MMTSMFGCLNDLPRVLLIGSQDRGHESHSAEKGFVHQEDPQVVVAYIGVTDVVILPKSFNDEKTALQVLRSLVYLLNSDDSSVVRLLIHVLVVVVLPLIPI